MKLTLIYISFQGELVTQNMSLGVIISTHSLVLQKVTRWHGGDYTCQAANPRGETMSRPVALRVRCKYRSPCHETTRVCYTLFLSYLPDNSNAARKLTATNWNWN